MDIAGIALLLQSMNAVQVAPPAPPVFVVPSVPQQRGKAERFTVDVEVRAGSELLWSGPMVVSNAQGSSFTRRLSEPGADDCGGTGYVQPAENALSVQIMPSRSFDAAIGLALSVRWTRSVLGACPFRNGSRNVELAQTIALAPGEATTLSGDGGVTIRLRRR